MIAAKFIIFIILAALFLIKMPWLYDTFISTTDDQMDSIAKTNKKSRKRSDKRNK